MTPHTTDDVVALWRLQSRYADIVNRRAWPELAEIFLPGATLDIDTVTRPPRRLVGPDEVSSFIADAVARFDHFMCTILNTVVEPAGDEATGRIFVAEIRHDVTTDAWQNVYGVYQDVYARFDDRWWFAERHYRSLARNGPDAAVLGLPPGLPPLG